MWIGCADSWVVPAQITSADPGELFEVRNIANVVPPADAPDDAVGAAIEYALNHLEIDDIVACGHTNCGGIGALLEPTPPGREAHLGRDGVAAGRVGLHGWLYDMDKGMLSAYDPTSGEWSGLVEPAGT